MQLIRLIGNILWHIPFLGFIDAILAFILGTILTLLVVTAPIGLGLISYSKFLLLPYSYEMVNASEIRGERHNLWTAYSFIIRIIYFPIGLILAIFALFQVIGLCLTIVGIPVAIPLAKSLGVFLNPVGKICVDSDTVSAIRMRKAGEKLDSIDV